MIILVISIFWAWCMMLNYKAIKAFLLFDENRNYLNFTDILVVLSGPIGIFTLGAVVAYQMDK